MQCEYKGRTGGETSLVSSVSLPKKYHGVEFQNCFSYSQLNPTPIVQGHLSVQHILFILCLQKVNMSASAKVHFLCTTIFQHRFILVPSAALSHCFHNLLCLSLGRLPLSHTNGSMKEGWILTTQPLFAELTLSKDNPA